MTLENDQDKGHMHPAKLAELTFIKPLLQIGDKEHKADNVKNETDKSMVGSER